MIYFSVDQIGEDHIECENDEGKICCFKIIDVPKNIKEGDILKFNKNGKLIKDPDKTKERKKDIKDIYDNIIKKR